MSVLVTGGAGYIGAHIVDILCEMESHVIVFDNLFPKKHVGLKKISFLLFANSINFG